MRKRTISAARPTYFRKMFCDMYSFTETLSAVVPERKSKYSEECCDMTKSEPKETYKTHPNVPANIATADLFTEVRGDAAMSAKAITISMARIIVMSHCVYNTMQN